MNNSQPPGQYPPPPNHGSPMPPQQPYQSYPPPAPAGLESDKSFVATWLLSLFLGVFGADRFYLGKIGTAILKLVTFGGLGVWWLVDLIIVLTGAARDRGGRPVRAQGSVRVVAPIVSAAVVLIGGISSAVNSAPNDEGVVASDQGASNAVVAEDAEPVPADEQPSPSPEASPEPESAEPIADEVQAEEPTQDEPTEEPTPTPEPTPEATVELSGYEAAQEWVDDRYGTFEVVTVQGTGDDLVDIPEGVSTALVSASYSGSGHFAVSVLDEANSATGDLLVNTIGTYSGDTAMGMHSWMGVGVTLEVSASGPWEITIAPMSSAAEFPASGAGDGVYLYDGPAARLTVDYGGSGHFAVVEETSDAWSIGLLVNDIGPYQGTVPLSAGPSVVMITAEGAWELSLS